MAKNPTNPKLKLFEDDPLAKALKKEHYDVVNPFTFNFDASADSTVPKSKFTFEATVGDDNDDGDNGDIKIKLAAPNLEDITVVKSEIYYDQKNVPHARFIFNVKNHVGDDVVGVYGKGG